MERASALFHQIAVGSGVSTHDPRYRNALFHLLTSQTSCYRYWGQGAWTDYGREICRRLEDILRCDFPQAEEGCGERRPD
ncbi:MAG: glycosyl hydrolase family 57, partial [Proteobacteria bacterium]|nr:glycosyl hydrolase family 57 [Pseudomonadota bacterium]